MSRYFAELDADNVVLRVIVCDDPDWIDTRLGGTWVETADPYVEAGEVAYCGPGHGHDPDWPVQFAPAWVQPVATDDGWTWYGRGDVRFHAGFLWVSTMDENVWEPGVSGWRRTPTVPGRPPVWTAPTGAHDAWQIGEHVLWPDADGDEYRCDQADGAGNNVWPPDGPGAFGWTKVTA